VRSTRPCLLFAYLKGILSSFSCISSSFMYADERGLKRQRMDPAVSGPTKREDRRGPTGARPRQDIKRPHPAPGTEQHERPRAPL
jgi:hypothetical protein